MKNKIYETKELYGVFCNDKTFRIYHHVILENTIHCLFDSKINKNTIIREELNLFSPLVVYNPETNNNKNTIYWLDGRFFVNDKKNYKAIRLDVILNEFLNIQPKSIDEELLTKIEKIMNKKIKTNNILYNNIWKNMVISEYDITKKNIDSNNSTYKSIIGNIDKLKLETGMEDLFKKYFNIIEKRVYNDKKIVMYKDYGTGEIVYDKYNKDHKLLNRKYYNERSKAILQIYFEDENIYYLCGINEKDKNISNLFLNNQISTTSHTTQFYKKRQRIK